MEDTKTTSWPHIQGFSPATAKIVEAIHKAKVGDTFADEQLTKLSGKDCSLESDGRRYVSSAIKYVERTHGVVWRRVRGAGAIKCLSASERIAAAQGYRQHIARSARRATRVIRTVQIDDVDEGERSNVLALAAQLGALTMFSGADAHKRLAARNVNSTPDIKALLEPFAKQ